MPPNDGEMDPNVMYFVSRKGSELVIAAGLNRVSALVGKTPLELYTDALENKWDELDKKRRELNMSVDEMRAHLLNALQLFVYYYVWNEDPGAGRKIQDMASNLPGVTEDMAYILYMSDYTDMSKFMPNRDVHVMDPNRPGVEISPVRVRTKEIFCDVLSKVIVDPDVAERLWLTVLALVSQMDGEVGPPCNGVGPCG